MNENKTDIKNRAYQNRYGQEEEVLVPLEWPTGEIYFEGPVCLIYVRVGQDPLISNICFKGYKLKKKPPKSK